LEADMPKTKKAKPAPDLSVLAERAADAVFDDLLDYNQTTQRFTAAGDPLDLLGKAAGEDWTIGDREMDFERALPENVRERFRGLTQAAYALGGARARAAYAFGLAMGKRLAKLEGGAR
jgi:hypothetical protein